MAAPPSGPCFYCTRPAQTWDHVVPRALGAPDHAWNRIPSCFNCNQLKGSITYENFTGKPFLPDRCREAGWHTTQQWLDAHPDLAIARRKRAEVLAAERQKRNGSIQQHPAYVGPTPIAERRDPVAAIARQFCDHASGACPACKHKVIIGLKLASSKIVLDEEPEVLK